MNVTRTPVPRIVNTTIVSSGFSSGCRYDITISDGVISSIDEHHEEVPTPSDLGTIDAQGRLVGSALCHAHIHLDKCFLLYDPKYSDLQIVSGDFQEALRKTSEAKARFEEEDLIRRGQWLIEESIGHGVTSMRAFVEVDATVGFKCLNAAVALQNQYKKYCQIQICVFAQDPIFSGPQADKNRELITKASERAEVKVLGTTPYVEDGPAAADENIKWAAAVADAHQVHLDFHLDYHLDPSKPALTERALELAASTKFGVKSPLRITLAHCTRLASYEGPDWRRLKDKAINLPVSFVGLPTSDIFMMGRPSSSTDDRVRGTLQVPHLIKEYGIDAAIAINNVGNAFTPYGNCDPLSIASMGVGLYQAGTEEDTAILYECVTSRAKRAIGIPGSEQPFAVGQPANFTIYGSSRTQYDSRNIRRRWQSLHQLIYDPARERTVIFQGYHLQSKG